MAMKCAGSYSLSSVPSVEKIKQYDDHFSFTEGITGAKLPGPSTPLPESPAVSATSGVRICCRKSEGHDYSNFKEETSVSVNVIDSDTNLIYSSCVHRDQDKARFSALRHECTISSLDVEFIPGCDY